MAAHWRTKGQNVSLAALAARDDIAGLLLYCGAGRAHYGGCFHSGKMAIAEALRRWPHDWCIDRLPVRCSKCGSREVDVRPHYIHAKQGAFVWRETDVWRAERAAELVGELARYLHALKPPKIN